LDDAAVYLVPIGAERFELYTEPPDEAAGAAHEPDSFWRRKARQLQDRWHHAVHAAHAAHAARGDAPPGRVAHARDWVVRHIAESIAEQRTLWSLRGVTSASFIYPADLTDASAAAIRARVLGRARRHHGVWLLVNFAAAAATAVLVLLPGPNVIGYYFVFRVIGHFLSWRGARQALDRTAWRGRPEPALTELAGLARLPRDARADAVAQIGERLHLPRLAAFFDRVAVPGH
jgi:hypothetical protein